jgi:phosphorylcholine metabolism protein LicD
MQTAVTVLLVLIALLILFKKWLVLLVLLGLLFVELPIETFDTRLYHSGFNRMVNDYIKISHFTFNKPLNLEIAKENLLLFNDIMNKHSIPYWLSEGTALGVIRDGSFILHDDDTDTSFMYEFREKFIKDVLPELKANGYVIGGVMNNENFITIHRKGEKIDIDIVQKDNKCMASYVKSNNYKLDCNYVLKFLGNMRKVNFLGTTFNVPGDDYLVALYTDSWRIPKKSK